MERLDRAALRAGASLDTVGDDKAVRRMENLDRSVQRVNRDVDHGNGLLGIFHNRWLLIGGLAVSTLPFLGKLSGAVVQLVGSLVQAAGGAGVIGGGAIGAFVVGVGSAMVVIKGLTGEIKKGQQAYASYTAAVKQYGAASAQAAAADRNLKTALSDAPRGTLRLLQDAHALGEAWDKATAKAKGYLVQTADNVIHRVRGVMPQIGGLVSANAVAVGGATKSLIDRLLSPESIAILQRVSRSFREDLPIAADAMGNLMLSFGRLTAAAAPFVKDFFTRFDQWTQRLDLSTRDTTYLRYQMSGLVAEFNHWLTFLGSTWRLLETVFRAATNTHTALGGINGDLERWAQWMNDNPVRVQRFFNSTGQAVHDLGSFLGYVVKLLGHLSSGPLWDSVRSLISQFAQPLSDLLTQIVTLITTLAGTLGPFGGVLSITLRLLTGVLTLINNILQAVPGLSTLLGGALAAFGIYKLMAALNGFVTGMGRAASETAVAAGEMNALAAATERAAIASRGIGVGGIGGGVRGVGGAAPYLFPYAGRARGFFGSRGTLVERPGTSMWGGDSPMLVGSSGMRGFFARRAAGAAGIAEDTTGIARGAGIFSKAGFLAKGGSMLGRIGGVAGPLSIGLMLASTFANPGGRAGGALSGASLGSLGFALGPEVGIPATLIGGLIGALTAKGDNSNLDYVKKMLNGWDETRGTGVNGGPRLGPGGPTGPGGRDKNPGTVVVHHDPLGRFGGSSPHTAAQVAGQIGVYRRILNKISGDNSPDVMQASQGLQQNLTALQQVLPGLKQKERHQGFTVAGKLGQAYNIVAPKLGAEAGMQFVLKQALGQWSGLTKIGKQELAQQLLDWSNEMRKQNPKLVGEFDAIKKSVIGKFAEIHGKVTFVNGHVLTDVKQKWKSISKAMRDPVEQAREAISKDMTAIQKQALGTLMAMGLTKGEARQVMAGMANGTGQQLLKMWQSGAPFGVLGPVGKPSGKAHGGRIPGSGLHDTVPVGSNTLAAPGELIVNRHTESRANAMLGMFGQTLGGLVGSETKPHYMATGGRMQLPATFTPTHDTAGLPGFPAIDSFAPPGTAVGAPGAGVLFDKHMIPWNITQRVGGLTGYYKTKLGTYFLTHFGTLVGSGTHLAGGQVMGTVATVPQNAWASHIHEGFHSGPYSTPTGGMTSGMGTGGGHGGGHGSKKGAGLTLSDLVGPGATTLPGSIVDSTGLRASAGIVAKLNKILGGDAGTSTSTGSGGGGGGGGGGIATLLREAGFRGDAITNFIGIAKAESGMNPRALNDNPATKDYSVGYWQENFYGSLGPARTARYAPRFGVAGLNTQQFVHWLMGHPEAQAKIAHDLFQSSGYAPWKGDAYVSAHGLATTGGRVPWYGDGGDFVARRPRLIGVGDKPERVTITPLSSSSTGHGGLPPITINIARIDASGTPGKIREMVRGEIRDAIADVASEMDRAGMVPDEEIF